MTNTLWTAFSPIPLTQHASDLAGRCYRELSISDAIRTWTATDYQSYLNYVTDNGTPFDPANIVMTLTEPEMRTLTYRMSVKEGFTNPGYQPPGKPHRNHREWNRSIATNPHWIEELFGEEDQGPDDGDTDGEGASDSEDPDIDDDGIANLLDPDANGDGIPDGEASCTTCA